MSPSNRERRNHYAVYAVNAPVIGFDTDRETFLGAYNGFDHPAAVERGESFNSMASGWSPVGSHHLRADLAPGARVSYLFVLGFCQNPDTEKFSAPGVANKAPARALLSRFSTEAQFDAAFEAPRRPLAHASLGLSGRKRRREAGPHGQPLAYTRSRVCRAPPAIMKTASAGHGLP